MIFINIRQCWGNFNFTCAQKHFYYRLTNTIYLYLICFANALISDNIRKLNKICNRKNMFITLDLLYIILLDEYRCCGPGSWLWIADCDFCASGSGPRLWFLKCGFRSAIYNPPSKFGSATLLKSTYPDQDCDSYISFISFILT